MKQKSKILELERGFYFDWDFIIKTIKNYIIILLSAGIIVGVSSYMIINVFVKDTYHATIVTALTPADNSSYLVNVDNYKSAIKRNLNMWKSDILLKLIRDTNPDRYIVGSLKAQIVNDSNLITITSEAPTAKDAYYLVHQAVKQYKNIEGNFDQSYKSVILTGASEFELQTKESKSLLLGIILMILFDLAGLAFIILWCMNTDVLHDEEQAKVLLDMPVYESLPEQNKSAKSLLITQKNITMDYLQSINKMTLRVEHHMKHYNKKIIMVTSIEENEGKSTVSSNLALNLAKKGKRVLLVDLDFRKPAIAKIFDKENEGELSLSEVLVTRKNIDQLVQKLPEFNNLFFIWQFDAVRDSDGILEASNIGKQLEHLSEYVDCIILDTPPVGPVRDTDVIANIANCTLLVIRQNRNSAAIANDVQDQLEKLGAPVMGVVLNRTTFKKNWDKHTHNNYGYNSYNFRKEL